MVIVGCFVVFCIEYLVFFDIVSDGFYVVGCIIYFFKYIIVYYIEVDESFFFLFWDYFYVLKLECCYFDILGGCCYCCLVEFILSKLRSFIGK